MAVCDTCGNDDADALTITRGSDSGTFDGFECAIHGMAPRCQHCSRPTSAAATAALVAPDSDPLPDKPVSRWKDDGGAIRPESLARIPCQIKRACASP